MSPSRCGRWSSRRVATRPASSRSGRSCAELGVDEANVHAGAAAGRTALDIGPIFRTKPGTEPSTKAELLLPDEVFLLAYGPSGQRRLDITAFEAGLAAAALAELRLRGRVRLAETGDTTVIVDGAPRPETGFWTACSPVSRPGHHARRTSGSRPSARTSPERSLAAWTCWGCMRATPPRTPPTASPYDDERVQQARSGIAHALNTTGLDSRGLVLGVLLWATELSAPGARPDRARVAVLAGPGRQTRSARGRRAYRDRPRRAASAAEFRRRLRHVEARRSAPTHWYEPTALRRTP